MQNQFIQWMTQQAMRTKQSVRCCVIMLGALRMPFISVPLISVHLMLFPSMLKAEEVEQPIQYDVTPVKGFIYGTVDGETAYQDWRRGTFDKEPMVEVKPHAIKKELPEPVVVPFSTPKVSEVPVGKPKKPPLKGEDKIFVQIGEDEIEARCFILGEGCEKLVQPEDEQDSVYFGAIEKAIEDQKQKEATSAKERTVVKP